MYGFSIIDKSHRETERSSRLHVLDLVALIPICSLASFIFHVKKKVFLLFIYLCGGCSGVALWLSMQV